MMCVYQSFPSHLTPSLVHQTTRTWSCHALQSCALWYTQFCHALPSCALWYTQFRHALQSCALWYTQFRHALPSCALQYTQFRHALPLCALWYTQFRHALPSCALQYTQFLCLSTSDLEYVAISSKTLTLIVNSLNQAKDLALCASRLMGSVMRM